MASWSASRLLSPGGISIFTRPSTLLDRVKCTNPPRSSPCLGKLLVNIGKFVALKVPASGNQR
jgi:hypothetical protein